MKTSSKIPMPKDMQTLIREYQIYELANILSQNKKDTKQLITDIAITKIPYISYPDMTVSQSLIIHELAEQVLKISKTQNQHNEIAITCNIVQNSNIYVGMDKILNNCGICIGNESEMDLFSNSKTMSLFLRSEPNSIISLHNHPSCGTFSTIDIATFLKKESLKMLVAVGNNGSLYYLSKNNNFDYLQARNFLVEKTFTICPEIANNINYKASFEEVQSIARLFLKGCHEFGISYEHAISNKSLSHQLEQNIKEYENNNEEYEYNND